MYFISLNSEAFISWFWNEAGSDAEQLLRGEMWPSVIYLQANFISRQRVAKTPILHWNLPPYRWIGFAWEWISSLESLIFWKVFLTQLEARNISRGSLISWTLRWRLAEDLVGIPGLILEVLMQALCWLFALDLENWIGLRRMTCYPSSGLLKRVWRSQLSVPQFLLSKSSSLGSCFVLSR